MKDKINNMYIAAFFAAISFLCGTVSLSACHDEDESFKENWKDNRIVFVSSVTTKTLHEGFKTEFTEGDKIGVYVVSRKETETAALQGTGNYVDNLPFKYEKSSNSFTAEKEEIYLSPNHVMDFYVYYPYREVVLDALSIPHTTGLRQDNKSEYGQSGFMIATFKGYKDSSSPVVLSFTNVVSQLEVTINKITGSEVEKVEVKGRQNQCRINLATGNSYTSEEKENITLYPFSETDKQYSFRVMLPPQTIPAKEELITVTMKNGSTKLYDNSSVLSLTSGKISNYTVPLQSRVKVSTDGKGTVSYSTALDGNSLYNDGEKVTVTSVSVNAGYKFSHWLSNGKKLSESSPYTFTVYENTEVVAVHQTSSGVVTVSQESLNGYHPKLGFNNTYTMGGGTFPTGTNITILAVPGEGYKFLRWSDGNTNPSRSVKVGTGTDNYKAIFERKSYTVTRTSQPTAGGGIYMSGSTYFGDRVELGISTNSGWTFDSWNDGVRTTVRYIENIDRDYSFTAIYYRDGL